MTDFTGKILRRQPLSGGDINEVSLLETEKGLFVEKRNPGAPADFFLKEALGLDLLGKNGLKVPQVIATGNDFLLLEYLPPGQRTKKSEEDAGRTLANLHSMKQSAFGLDHENYIGSLRQTNGTYSNWAEFYVEKRIQPMLEQYFKKERTSDFTKWIEFYDWIYQNVQSSSPSLLHGDIWSGNLYYGLNGPVFLDPAVYYGDCMVDLAFSELFGGFGSGFYSAYREVKSVDDSYQYLKDVYQIYPLLVHANLFGGHYYKSAFSRVLKFI